MHWIQLRDEFSSFVALDYISMLSVADDASRVYRIHGWTTGKTRDPLVFTYDIREVRDFDFQLLKEKLAS